VPRTNVVFFVDKSGTIPAVEWIADLPEDVQEKLSGSIRRLGEMGYELRRPECDYLRDNIYELRVRLRRINYRLLYFYCQNRAVISHGLIKENIVPVKEIDKAICNKILCEQYLQKHIQNMKI
jgi:hypothetical protein